MTIRLLEMSFTFRAADNPVQFDASPYISGTFVCYVRYDDEGDDMGKGVFYVQEVLAERGEEFAGVLVDGINCGVEDKDNRAAVMIIARSLVPGYLKMPRLLRLTAM